MSRRDRNRIVADGRWRILDGSAREEAARVRARLTRRTAPLWQQASLVGRLVIRFRISRFVRRHLDRLAPPGALYLSLDLQRQTRSEPRVTPRATSNQSMKLTASKPAIYALGVCHPRFLPVDRLLGLAAADLVSR